MEFLTELWVPILLSAVFVFVVSSVMHMVLPFHKSDCKGLPGEDDVLAEMRKQAVQPGAYFFPAIPCGGSMKEMGSPEMQAKLDKGPVGFMTVMPNGGWNMGKSLVQWFLYSVILGVIVAYVARLGLAPGADYLKVFQLTGAVAMLGYATSYVHDGIWKGGSWCVVAKFMFDGIVYALVTAGTFAWLWPAAV